MKLTVAHDTIYRYDRPMAGVFQSLRVMPSVSQSQQIIDWHINVTGGQRGGAFRDGAGDRIEAWTVRGPVSEVAVSVSGQVETSDTAGILRGHREAISPLVYLRPGPMTQVDDAIRDLAHGIGAEDGLDRAHALANAVADAIVYTPGVTDTATTAAEALAHGKGVCQDHAHVLIAAARVLAMPARYVSGYLYATEDGTPHDAAHAWAELHVGGLGWVGFDPANHCCPDDRYIRLGSGFDAQDAAPIRGVSVGPGQGRIDVTVAVGQQQQ